MWELVLVLQSIRLITLVTALIFHIKVCLRVQSLIWFIHLKMCWISNTASAAFRTGFCYSLYAAQLSLLLQFYISSVHLCWIKVIRKHTYWPQSYEQLKLGPKWILPPVGHAHHHCLTLYCALIGKKKPGVLLGLILKLLGIKEIINIVTNVNELSFTQ